MLGTNREKNIKKTSELEERKELQNHLEMKKKEITSLLDKIEDFKKKMIESDMNEMILAKLYDSDIIDENGIPIKNKEDDNNDMN